MRQSICVVRSFLLPSPLTGMKRRGRERSFRRRSPRAGEMEYGAMNISSGGYRCVICGTWISNGSFHQCGFFQPQIQSSPAEIRIAAALERIATALESARPAQEKESDRG